MKKLFVLAIAIVALVLVTAQVVVGEQQLVQRPVAFAQEEEETPTPVEIPFLEEWLSSGHADAEAEAFVHWDGDDPAEVPADCAKCHSQYGYHDFLGIDDTEAGVVDNAAPIGSVVSCVTCHNDATMQMTSVVMPSGIELTGLGDEARCMQCHQGRESKVSVDQSIADAEIEDVDAVSADLRFRNIHYYAAAATKYGTLAKGGYEYDDKTYDGNFSHVAGFESCIQCHNPHTLEVKVDACADCHTGVAAVEDIRDIRMEGSLVDYDGDGDTDEGIYFELAGMQELAMMAIQAYAGEVAGTPIAYDAHRYPYFFLDANDNGEVDEDESDGYNAWTARLLKAAYNYQTSAKDPGAYAHGGKYIIQLLHDSVEDLNMALADPVDLSTANRIDAGHFAGSEEAFRHWDDTGVVPGSCAKCHTGSGLPLFLAEDVNISAKPSNGLDCATCHNDLAEFTIHEIEEVRFPSGAMISAENMQDNLCLNCHQGRESTVSVDRRIGDSEADEVVEGLGFVNVHYFAAGATRFGTEVQGAYEYADQEYVGNFEHSRLNSCSDCHATHALEVRWEDCSGCHQEVEGPEDVREIRYFFADYDGDGDDEEGIAHEIDTLIEDLYAALRDYAANEVGTAIVYNPARHPYFFVDANGNGEVDADDTERYVTWTPRLLRGAYNYQYASKDPGAFAHNGLYILQVLYDSIEDLGGDVSAMTRP